MKKRKPKIGETLFLVDVGNRARHGRGKQRDCTVTKVGRKYFYVVYDGRWSEVQFSLETRIEHSDYSADHAIYESRQEWEDTCLATKYRDAIKDAFVTGRFGDNPAYNATLPQLKQIAKILNITLEEDKT